MADSNKPKHPEAKGIFLILGGAALLLSLMSFIHGDPQQNWLGLLGYSVGYAFNFLLGIMSYTVAALFFVMGVRAFTSSQIGMPRFKIVTYCTFILSLGILLNLFAETQGLEYSFFKERVIAQTIKLKTPTAGSVTRYNLGGVPLYYFYRDLPRYNLYNVLSNVGIFLTSTTTLILSLIFLLDIRVLDVLRRSKRVSKDVAAYSKRLYKSVELPNVDWNLKKKKKEPLPQPIPKKPAPTPVIEEVHEPEPLPEPPPPIEPKNTPLPKLLQNKKKPSLAFDKPTEKKRTYKGTYKNYKLPPLNLLSPAKQVDAPTLKRDLQEQAEVLEETLASFGIEAKVGEINCGPTITSFEVHPAVGVKVQKITALENDIALNLQAASIRIIAPIPGKAAVGVEIPSLHPQEVGFKDMMHRYKKNPREFNVPILLGKTVSGDDVMCDLTKWPHAIIAGATGSGKSVCINTIIMSLLMNARPYELKLILIDPKKVELTPYTALPHMIAPVITEAHGAMAALNWLVKEMQNRYEMLKALGLRNITAFNARKVDEALEESLDMEIPKKLPIIITIIDEFADLMMTSSSDLETPIARIAQMARAVGIHLILATQRPSREVITGLIKANFPTRIAFKVASRVNSQIILDENGAETLLGNGDMLFLPPGTSTLIRSQGVYIRDEDISRVINYISNQAPHDYLIKSFDTMNRDEISSMSGGDDSRDTLLEQAYQIVVQTKTASTTYLQRKLKIGYARAASLMDELEDKGIIGPPDGSRPRKVLVSEPDLFDSEM